MNANYIINTNFFSWFIIIIAFSDIVVLIFSISKLYKRIIYEIYNALHKNTIKDIIKSVIYISLMTLFLSILPSFMIISSIMFLSGWKMYVLILLSIFLLINFIIFVYAILKFASIMMENSTKE